MLVTLSLTLAAVLTVVAISSNLIFKPLPDIENEKSLYAIDNKINFGSVSIDVFNVEFLAHLANKYQSLGDFATLDNDKNHVSFNISDTLYDTINFTATRNVFDVIGNEFLLGEAPNKDNIKQGVWISESLWHGALESRSNIIGNNITIGDKNYLIKGVVKDFVSFQSNEQRSLQQVWSLYNLTDYFNNDLSYDRFGSTFKTFFRSKSRLITKQEIDDFWETFKSEHSESIDLTISNSSFGVQN